MRLDARTGRLERRFPPPRTFPGPEWASELFPAHLIEWAVSLGCERHLEKGELGEITVAQWFRRLSCSELLLLEEAALKRLAEEDARARAARGVAP